MTPLKPLGNAKEWIKSNNFSTETLAALHEFSEYALIRGLIMLALGFIAGYTVASL